MLQAKKLSIAELKANSTSNKVIANIEAINGGGIEEYCHNGYLKPIPLPVRNMQNMLDKFLRR